MANLATKMDPNVPDVKHRGGARLSKFTTERRETIIAAAGQGLPLASCADLVGVSKHTIADWMDKGETQPDSPYEEFVFAVRSAQARFKLDLLQKIERIGTDTKQWVALMTLLERVFGDEFKRPSTDTKVTVNVGILEQRVHELVEAGEHVYDGN